MHRIAHKHTLNDADRAQWIDNDEGLYRLWLRSRKGKTVFIRENRALIDAYVLPMLNGKPQTWSEYH